MKELPEDHIRRIYDETGSTPRDAKNLVQSLTKFSDDLYASDERFLYELLQNADDTAEIGEDVAVQIELSSGFLLFSHNGRHFSYDDADAISNIGDSTKASDPTKTGYKGIGFKSVFGRSDCVFVKSGEYTFRYDVSFFGDKEGTPWQIKPIWTNNADFPLAVRESDAFNGSNVLIALRVDDCGDLKKSLHQLVDEPRLLLFLRHVCDIRVSSDELLPVRCSKVRDGCTLRLLVDKDEHSDWYVGDFDVVVPAPVRSRLQDDSKVPEKLKAVERTRLSYAARVTREGLHGLKKGDSVLFSYLPTRASHYGFPFLVNADFLTTASREAIHDENPWNQFLFEAIGENLPLWLKQIAGEARLAPCLLKLIPKFVEGQEEILSHFAKGFERALLEVDFVPTLAGALAKVGEVLVDKTGVSSVIGEELFNSLFPTPHSLVATSLEDSSRLVSWGASVFDTTDLVQLLRNPDLDEKLDEAIVIQLLSHLFEHARLADNDDVLRAMPLISDEGRVVRPGTEDLYLSIDPETRKLLRFGHFPVLHPAISAHLDSSEGLKTWVLQKVGLKVFSPAATIRDKLDTEASLQVMRPDDVVPISRFILANQNELSQSTLKKLRDLPVLHSDGTIGRVSNAFLSVDYAPSYPLEDVAELLKAGPFISSNYLNGPESKKEWSQFFCSLGARNYTPTMVLRNLVYPRVSDETLRNQDFLVDIASVTKDLLASVDGLNKIHKEALAKFPLLIKGGGIQNANLCYLADEFAPEYSLEQVSPTLGIDRIHFVDPLYLKDGQGEKDWREFFYKLGVVKPNGTDICAKYIVPSLSSLTQETVVPVARFLFECYKKAGFTPQLKKSLAATPLLTEEVSLREATACLLPPSINKGLSVLLESEIPVQGIASEEYLDFGPSDEVKEFLKELGAKELDQAESVRRICSAVAESESDIVTPGNAIKIGRLLFHHRAYLTGEMRQQLKRLPVLTNGGKTVDAGRAYLCQHYAPPEDFEFLFEGTGFALFVCSEYVEKSEDIAEWKKFFFDIGVNSRLRSLLGKWNIQFGSDRHSYLRHIGVEGKTAFFAAGQSLVSSIDEYLGELPFTERLWPHLERHWDDFSSRAASLQLGQQIKEVEPHFQYVLRVGKSIPCIDGQCRRPSETYDQSLLHIVGHQLPVASIKLPPEIADYIGLRTELTFSDAISLLDGLADLENPSIKQSTVLYKIVSEKIESGLTEDEQSFLNESGGALRLRSASGAFK